MIINFSYASRGLDMSVILAYRRIMQVCISYNSGIVNA